MGVAGKLRLAIGVVIISALAARADDCVSTLVSVSQEAVNPNRPATRIAWNGSIIGVAKNENSGAKPIYFSTYDEQLHALTSDVQVTAASVRGVVGLVATTSEFGVFFEDATLQLKLQRVSASGSLIGGAVDVAPRTISQSQEYAFAFDRVRDQYVVLHTIRQGFEKGLWLALVNRAGATVYDQLMLAFISDPTEPRVAVRPDGTVGIVMHRSDTGDALFFFTFSRDNIPGAGFPFSNNGQSPSLTWDGSEWVAAFRVTVMGGTEIHWSRFDDTHVITADTRLFSGRGVDVAPIDLEWNPAKNELALSYLDSILGFSMFPGEYRLRRFTRSGAPLSDVLFSPDVLKNLYGTSSPFVATGNSYISPIERNFGASGTESYLVRHCPLAAEVTLNIPAPHPGDVVTFHANVSGGTPPYSYEWDFGDLSGHTRETDPQHSFRAGHYTVTLSVTDSAGGTTVATRDVVVAECGDAPPPPVIASADRTFALPRDVIHFSSSSPFPVTWNFGDGSPLVTGATVAHQFAQRGRYTVVASATSSCGAPQPAHIDIVIGHPKGRAARH